jgi:hypothetical protein
VLKRAAQHGRKDTVEVLLGVGKADVEAKSNSGRTALMHAALGDGGRSNQAHARPQPHDSNLTILSRNKRYQVD